MTNFATKFNNTDKSEFTCLKTTTISQCWAQAIPWQPDAITLATHSMAAKPIHIPKVLSSRMVKR